ncbi:putative sperm motility kinase W, partial [Mastomys coucha]|uniref:putative sperm motility kinase W n=1 Tax=Mastomys coucha TaxID=35658 RepID=UPI0012620F7B
MAQGKHSLMASTSNVNDLGSQYRVFFYLGEGSFGTVKLAWHLKTKALVAIKMIEISKKAMSDIQSEQAILQRLNHPNIIRLFQVMVTPSHVNFVLEYCSEGSLFNLIHQHGPLQGKEAKKAFGQIVAAVKYLHNSNIIHRDIKPENILKDAEGNMKLTDFGLAAKCRPGRLLNQKCGTKVFHAPELVLGEPYDGRKADIWSLGVLLYFITTGYYPFTGRIMKMMENKIITGTYRIPCNFSGTLENLIHQILTVPPEMRPSIEDIERHSWVMKCQVTIPTDTYPDYNIIDILCDMGFNANEILESLQKKMFDENMGTYLLLKEQASEPNFGLLHIWPSGQQGPVTPTPSGHKATRSVSMPSIALHCPKKNNI